MADRKKIREKQSIQKEKWCAIIRLKKLSQVGFPRRKVKGGDWHIGCLIGRALGTNSCRSMEKEVGLGRGKS